MDTYPVTQNKKNKKVIAQCLLYTFFNDKAMVVYLLMALLLVLSLVHKTGFDLFGINAEHIHSLNIALLGVHFFFFLAGQLSLESCPEPGPRQHRCGCGAVLKPHNG